MKRIRRAALAVATALVAVLATAVPAYATTTKTNGPLTVHVVGTKLHVDYVWFSETLTGGQTFHGDFWVEIDSPNGEHRLSTSRRTRTRGTTATTRWTRTSGRTPLAATRWTAASRTTPWDSAARTRQAATRTWSPSPCTHEEAPRGLVSSNACGCRGPAKTWTRQIGHGAHARSGRAWARAELPHLVTEPGRNDAWPCGSGRKYERCCGA